MSSGSGFFMKTVNLSQVACFELFLSCVFVYKFDEFLWKINVETVLTRLASAYVKFYVVEAFCFRKECR